MAQHSKLEHMMKEVHKNIPSTVERANVSGKKKEAMLRAIAFSKARKAGVELPRVIKAVAEIPKKKWRGSDTGKTKI